MTFDHFQELAARTSFTAHAADVRLDLVALGLVGEAGELAEVVKKWIRDPRLPGDADKVAMMIASEAGDLLWNMAEAMTIEGKRFGKLMEREARTTAEAKGTPARLARNIAAGAAAMANSLHHSGVADHTVKLIVYALEALIGHFGLTLADAMRVSIRKQEARHLSGKGAS